MPGPERFGVDPAELLSASSAAEDVAAAVRSARAAVEDVAPASVISWAQDVELSRVASQAVEVVARAAELAAARAAWLAEGLRVSAESYARSDEQWVR